MNNIIEIRNLSKDYYTNKEEIAAISNISLDIKEGEFIAIVGPSGCGKSTLLNIIGNLDNRTSGDILFPLGKNKISYMFQQDCLFDHLSIFDNCMLGLKIAKKDNKQNRDKVIRLLNSYGLGKFINSNPRNLSGGMRQRVALIRTLATNPDILLLDEPFSALDYQTRLAVSDDVYNIIKKENKTSIMITHDIAEAISMADRVVVLSSRPSTVKVIYDIKLTDKSSPINNRTCKEFNSYYQTIWRSIEHEIS